MIALIPAALALHLSGAAVVPAQIFHLFPAPLRARDAPGLTCRALLHPDWAYAGPSGYAAKLVMLGVAVPVTGAPVRGFVPVLLGTGQPGWMPFEAFRPDNYVRTVGHCHVTLQPNGRPLIRYSAR